MAEVTKKIPSVKEEVVVVPHVAEPVAVVEKAAVVAVPEAEKAAVVDVAAPVAEEEEKEKEGEDDKVAESASFKEESNVVADLPNPQQKALDEFKELVKSALEKHEFTAPPPPPVKEPEVEAPVEEKKESDETVVESKPEETVVESKPEEKKAPESAPVEVSPPKPEVVKVVEPKVAEPKVGVLKVLEKVAEKVEKVVEKVAEPKVAEPKVAEPKVAEPKVAEPKVEPKVVEPKVVEPKVAEPKVAEPKGAVLKVLEKVAEKVEKVVEPKVEEKKTTPPAVVEKVVVEPKKVEEKIEPKVEAVEEIKETIVEVTTPTPAPAVEATEEATPIEEAAETEATPPPTPEEVSIWGIKLLEDDRSDAILLKFLRARDFKVKEAFAMLKSVVQWRKEFGIDSLIEEETSSEGLEKVVYLHGVDKEGHLVLYNSFGEFQDKELYQNTFADAEKRTKFLRGIIQFFEKTIRSLDFTPDGLCTLFQVIDLKNSPGLFFFKKDLRQAISQALQIFQDNYPEFVAKQVYINVPWWFRAYYSMINAIFSPRTKSKFIFAGPSKSAVILFKYITPENVPVRYGGLSKEDGSEFVVDTTTEVIIKPATKHTIEFEVTENSTSAWELRVVGWDISYGAEFVPSAEGGYTVIIQKTRKVGPTDEPIIASSYTSGESGKVVLTINNQSSKRKNLVYRSKNKPSD